LAGVSVFVLYFIPMSSISVDAKSAFLGACLYAVLLTVVWLYWPGLDGAFMLDDEPHLSELKQVGTRQNPDDVRRFVLGGRASSLGRPLAMASFLLNDVSWPTDPWSFKYTNVMIHALTGVLLFWLAFKIARLQRRDTAVAGLVALLASAAWMLHPLNVSTVLYVIQRMTEIAALCTVAGLLAYTHGRTIAEQRPIPGYLWMSAGIGLGTIVGTLAKETAALLPLYALVLEFTLLRNARLGPPRGWTAWAFAFLYLPLLALGAYLLLHFDSSFRAYVWRPFDMPERLLTEPRILLKYLSLILVPRRAGSGVYHDDYAASTGLLDPPYTALALGAMAALLALAFAARRRAPVFSFAVLWFFAGHLLEAGIIPLELYFEHRNYLPMFGPLFALIWYGVQYARRGHSLVYAALAAFVVLSGVVTWQRATLWGNGVALAETWAAEHPESVRANQYAAHFWARYGRYKQASHYLNRILEFAPNSSGTLMGLVLLDCHEANLDSRDMDRIAERLKTGTRDFAGPESLNRVVELYAKHDCRPVSGSELQKLADAMIVNPMFRDGFVQAQLYYLKARIFAADGNLDAAVRYLQLAYSKGPNVDIALRETEYLLSAGLFDDALAALGRARAADSRGRVAKGLRAGLIDDWERVVHRLIEEKRRSGTPTQNGGRPAE